LMSMLSALMPMVRLSRFLLTDAFRGMGRIWAASSPYQAAQPWEEPTWPKLHLGCASRSKFSSILWFVDQVSSTVDMLGLDAHLRGCFSQTYGQIANVHLQIHAYVCVLTCKDVFSRSIFFS
jgi:hypothetical protein